VRAASAICFRIGADRIRLTNRGELIEPTAGVTREDTIMTGLRTKLSQGKPTFGAWVGLGHTHSAELMGKAGYDWVIVDTQHSSVGRDALFPVLQTLGGTPALVRVTWTDQAQIMRALDFGAAGVVVPMVSTPEQARLAAEACRYPPKGNRSFGPVRTYYAADGAAQEPLCFVMAETAEALENIEAIASTPGVDGIFVGAHDLAISLGAGVLPEMPKVVLDAMDRIVAVCGKHDVIPGCAAVSLANAKQLAERGVRFLAAGADLAFIMRGSAQDLAEIKSWGF
jgi:4-hydroxy-2-oxoheptanedioate aldolase